MTESAFDVCLAFTLSAEGGYQDDPDDPGNYTGGAVGVGTLVGTNFGISAPTLVRWMGDESDRVTAAFMKALPKETVESIYGAHYWNVISGNQLTQSIALSVFDHGVNRGPRRSVLLLQQALGFHGNDLDGVIGPITLMAANHVRSKSGTVKRLRQYQIDDYQSLSGFSRYGDGWLARAARRAAAALDLANREAAMSDEPVFGAPGLVDPSQSLIPPSSEQKPDVYARFHAVLDATERGAALVYHDVLAIERDFSKLLGNPEVEALAQTGLKYAAVLLERAGIPYDATMIVGEDILAAIKAQGIADATVRSGRPSLLARRARHAAKPKSNDTNHDQH